MQEPTLADVVTLLGLAEGERDAALAECARLKAEVERLTRDVHSAEQVRDQKWEDAKIARRERGKVEAERDSMRAQLREARELVDLADDYAGHSSGCPQGYDPGRPCTCGWRDASVRISEWLARTSRGESEKPQDKRPCATHDFVLGRCSFCGVTRARLMADGAPTCTDCGHLMSEHVCNGTREWAETRCRRGCHAKECDCKVRQAPEGGDRG